MKSRILLGTSWKMNKTLREAVDYLTRFKAGFRPSPRLQVFIVAPFTTLWGLKELMRETPLLLGAQNMHWADEGAYTGEVSPMMLKEVGVDLVELGHTERRAYYNETDYSVNQKVKAALAHGITPLVCVGEGRAEKEFGVTNEVLDLQVKIALHGLTPGESERVWVAYEPAWAIGEGGTPATPEYAEAVQGHIHATLQTLFGMEVGKQIPVLYGGSVNSTNAVSFASQPHVDGLFIGRAAWQPESFLGIIRAVEEGI